MHTLHSICALMLFLYVYKDQYLVNTIFPSASIDVQSTFVHCQKLSITNNHETMQLAGGTCSQSLCLPQWRDSSTQVQEVSKHVVKPNNKNGLLIGLTHSFFLKFELNTFLAFFPVNRSVFACRHECPHRKLYCNMMPILFTSCNT